MSYKSTAIYFTWMVMLIGMLVIPGWSADSSLPEKTPIIQGENPVAEVVYSAGGISFIPKFGYDAIVLSVSGPDGAVASKRFDSGSTPYFGLSDFEGLTCLDGKYSFELRVIPDTQKKVRTEQTNANIPKERIIARSQSGHFSVLNGSIISSSSLTEGRSRVNDVLHYDDVIITGSLCIGFDCVNGESFGYNTLKLKENNLRLNFEDTSIGTFPTGDWTIMINDTTSGGANYFSIQDSTNYRRIFTLEGGAPAHSLYVEDYGRVGLGTSVPYVELHIVDGDSPTVRLDQDGSSGWAAQRWDLCGNETNFFIRDVTNGSKLCFRIQPNTPSNTLCMRSTGNVGIGTWSPEYPLEVETTGTGAFIVAQRTDGATLEFGASGSFGIVGSRTDHPVKVRVNTVDIMQVNGSGHYIDMAVGGGYYDGDWVNGSSREFKNHIKDLSAKDAFEALHGLQPVTYKRKVDQSEEHVGFIAEDVPDLVATKSRKALSPMDITAVLTKVVQEQNKKIERLEKELAKLKKSKK